MPERTNAPAGQTYARSQQEILKPVRQSEHWRERRSHARPQVYLPRLEPAGASASKNAPMKATRAKPKTQSAGIFLFRRTGNGIEVLLGHPGGPFWKKKDEGAWSVPKGLITVEESPLEAAKREFEEETSHQPTGDFIPLGGAKQPGGKFVYVWAVENDWDPKKLESNEFEMERPP